MPYFTSILTTLFGQIMCQKGTKTAYLSSFLSKTACSNGFSQHFDSKRLIYHPYSQSLGLHLVNK